MYIYGILTSEVEEVDEVKLRRYFAASTENLSDDLDTCKEINYTGYALFSECPTTFQKKKCHELFYRNNEEWRIYKKITKSTIIIWFPITGVFNILFMGSSVICFLSSKGERV